MNNQWITAFVDETGTNELDSTKPNVSHLFICVAIIVDEAGLKKTEAAMLKLSEEFCGGAEIKSNKIGKKHDRRLKFLNGIKDLPFEYFALVINKEQLNKDSGYQYKTSFHKAINSMLFQKLANRGARVRIFADRFGTKEFMDSFTKYFDNKIPPDLFNKFEHSYAESKETPLIQLADLIAGTLSYCFDDSKKSEFSSKFRKIIKEKEIGIDSWPKKSYKIPKEKPKSDSEWNERLKKDNINRAIDFIYKHQQSNDIDRRMQASTLSRLLFVKNYEIDEKQSVFAVELINQLARQGFEKISEQDFRSKIIGKIRDGGIILSGSGRGIRLATTIEEICKYMKHDSNMIEPMLTRLLLAVQATKIDTSSQLDIFQSGDMKCLKALIDCYEKNHIK